MLSTRTATVEDALHITGLLHQLGYEVTSALVGEKLETLSGNSMDRVLVAEIGTEIVGVASLHVLELFHAPGRLGRITSLVVDAKHRRLGIGKLLATAADKYFVERGCVRTEVTSGEGRLEAHTFYQAIGFEPDERRFVKHYGLTQRSTSLPSVAGRCAIEPRSAG